MEKEAKQWVTCRFLNQLCKKKRFFWGSCRNITVPSYCITAILCRASFRVRAEILVLGRNIHLCHGLKHNIKRVGIYVWAAHKSIFYEGDLKWKVNWWLFILKMLRLWGSFQISGPGAQILSWVSTPQDKRRRRWRWWARPRTMPCPSPWIWYFLPLTRVYGLCFDLQAMKNTTTFSIPEKDVSWMAMVSTVPACNGDFLIWT